MKSKAHGLTLRFKDIEEESPLRAVQYDFTGGGRPSGTSSPVETQVLRLFECAEEFDRALCNSMDGTATAVDLINRLHDPADIDVLIDVYIRGYSIRKAADVARMSEKTILNRKGKALDALEELIEEDPEAARLYEELIEISERPVREESGE